MTAVVYFVQVGSYVKIGFSRNISARLKTFRTSYPYVELLLTLPGGRPLEKQLHELLAEDRIERELFKSSWRVMEFIDRVKQDGSRVGLAFLAQTTAVNREKVKRLERAARVHVARSTRAEKDAYFASLVAQRRQQLGW